MAASTGACPPRTASPSRLSSRSVMPESAECTTTGCRPSARRAFSTSRMLRQLADEETLVPPNLRTTKGAGWLVIGGIRARAAVDGRQQRKTDAAPAAAGPSGVVFEVFQGLLEATLGEHVLELAPGGLALLARL